MQTQRPATRSDDETTSGEGPVVNGPNVLSAVRLLLAPVMLAMAFLDHRFAFLVVFLISAATDWVDGKLAVWSRQRTKVGAVLDSVADVAMYVALLLGAVWLMSDLLWNELGWIAVALAAYVVNVVAAVIKFRRLPSYHTYAAKVCWFLTTLAAVALIAGWAVWPLRVAMVTVALANFEALLITLCLDAWRVDTRSLWHARKGNWESRDE